MANEHFTETPNEKAPIGALIGTLPDELEALPPLPSGRQAAVAAALDASRAEALRERTLNGFGFIAGEATALAAILEDLQAAIAEMGAGECPNTAASLNEARLRVTCINAVSEGLGRPDCAGDLMLSCFLDD